MQNMHSVEKRGVGHYRIVHKNAAGSFAEGAIGDFLRAKPTVEGKWNCVVICGVIIHYNSLYSEVFAIGHSLSSNDKRLPLASPFTSASAIKMTATIP